MHPTNFRNPILSEPRIFGGQYGFNTPAGVVASGQPPPLPPRPVAYNNSSLLGNSGYLYGNSHGYYNGFNGFGSFGGYSGAYGNNFGNNMSPSFPEYRFIQMAEESSRPAFQNIQSLVGTIGNIATMLDSTFFALTSSFRAVLGVAANFAHLRGVFAHFWTSFALFRWIIYAYKKMLYFLRITKSDPSAESFREAFKKAELGDMPEGQKRGSSTPVILFLGFIMWAPYLLTKFFGNKDIVEKSKNPNLWINPVEAVAIYDFDASNSNELSIRAGQPVLIAPKTVQVDHNLLNTGWILASVDNIASGVIPVNYVQGNKQQNQSMIQNSVQSNEQHSTDA